MCNCSKNQRQIGLKHDTPSLFIASQWQYDKTKPNWKYFFLRLCIFILYFVFWILTIVLERADNRKRWPIYLTNWGLTLCMLQSFLGTLMLLGSLLGKSSLLRYYSLYWLLNVMAMILALTITLIYWSLVYTAAQWSAVNFMVHGCNSILMLLDLCFTAHPVRIMHFVYPICVGCVYSLTTATFYMAGGRMSDGSPYIYPFLKWDEPGPTTGYLAMVLVVMVVWHMVTFLLYLLKNVLHKCVCASKINSSDSADYNDPTEIIWANLPQSNNTTLAQKMSSSTSDDLILVREQIRVIEIDDGENRAVLTLGQINVQVI